MKHLRQLLPVTRPRFLALPPICIALGIAAGATDGGIIAWSNLIPVILGGLAAHAGVNAFNEYADFHSGLDFKTDRTPFSGGSGTLIHRPDLAAAALWLGVAMTLVTLCCGLWLLGSVGLGLLPFGLVGLGLVIFYSGPITRNRWLSLVAPGIGFGPLMVGGSALAVTGTVGAATLVGSISVFFLINNLLLLNQFPDRTADASVGRDNWVIAAPTVAAAFYVTFAIATYLIVLGGVMLWNLPPLSLLALLTIPLSGGASQGALGMGNNEAIPLRALGFNVITALGTPALLAAGLSAALWLGA